MTELLNTLYVQTQGASLHLDHDSVRVSGIDGDGRRQLPLRRLDSIILYGHVAVSAELLARCAEDGRPVVWMSLSGRFLARADGPVRGNVLLRHAQHVAHADPARRLAIARCCVAGKIQNSRQVLLKGARDASGQRQEAIRTVAGQIAEMLPAAEISTCLEELLGAEGQAARLYYKGFGLLLGAGPQIPTFIARTKRPPTDPVNALLSFLYGLLRTTIHGAAEQVGLDPYIGFLHGLRPGKPALALDLMEEYRPILADRLALSLLNRRQVQQTDFEHLPGGAVRLNEGGRKTVLGAWQQSKQRQWSHGLLGRRVPMSLLPAVQARILARHIRGELPSYVPWLAS